MPIHATPANRMLELEKERAKRAEARALAEHDAEQTARDERGVLNAFWPTPAWSVLEVTLYRRKQILMNMLMDPTASHDQMVDARAGVRELNWILNLRADPTMRKDLTE